MRSKWCRMKYILMVSIKAGRFEVLPWCQHVMRELIEETGQEIGPSWAHGCLLRQVNSPTAALSPSACVYVEEDSFLSGLNKNKLNSMMSQIIDTQ